MQCDHLEMINFSLGNDAVLSIASSGGDVAEVAIITDKGFIDPANWADVDTEDSVVQVYNVQELSERLDQALIWLSEQ